MTGKLNAMKSIKLASRLLDVLLALGVMSIVVLCIYWWPVFDSDGDALEKPLIWTGVILVLRCLLEVPLVWLRQQSRLRQVQLVAGGVVVAFCVMVLMVENLKSDILAVLVGENLFGDASDDEVMIDLTDSQKLMPQHSFVMKLLDTIPEEDGVVYFGDQRAHQLSYILYPRRVYVLPELQRLQDKAVQSSYDWTPGEDPLFPKKDPNTHKYHTLKDTIDEKTQAELREMIAARGIEWVVYYDSVHPTNSWVQRIEP